MADPIEPIAGPAPAGLGPAGTQQDPPSQASAAADPAGVTSAAPAADAAAAAAPVAPAADVKPAEVKSELATDMPSLLEGAGAKDPLKPAGETKDGKAEAKPAEAAKPGDVAKPVDPAAAAAAAAAQPEPLAPIEYKYTLPETLKLDDALKADVHAAFDAFRANPADVQPLIDLHARTMQNFAEEQRLEQHRAFIRTREAWATEVKADKEIGGAGYQTAMQAAARVRDALAGQDMMAPRQWPDGKPRHSELEEFLRVTGAGDHPVFLKMLRRAARFIDEPQAAEIPVNPKPPPNNGRAPGRGRASIYDNTPSFQK